MSKKLGIIAGGGDLPKQLIARCKRDGREFCVLAFEGQTDPSTCTDVDYTWVRLGAVGKALSYFKKSGVGEIVLVGPLRRPSWSEIIPDTKGVKWLSKLVKAQGDDSMFRIIMNEIESEGFKVIGADDVMGDEIMAPHGVLGKISPSSELLADIKYGIEVAHHIGNADIGQAVVIQQSMVLGIEAIEGTKELVTRCAKYARPGGKPVLIKISKPGQERRVDLPTIGPQTIEQVADSGFAGIAVETGEVQILDMKKSIQKADQLGIFIIGININA